MKARWKGQRKYLKDYNKARSKRQRFVLCKKTERDKLKSRGRILPSAPDTEGDKLKK